jgi:hypothetical protein
LVLAQIVTIIFVSRIFSFIFFKIHQPPVIGEIIAGIALGPSLLGMLFPEFSMALFPENSLGNLNLLSQVGLILFMFMVGMELDIKSIQNRVKEAVVVSNAGILIPFTLGMGLAYFIYDHFAPKGVPFLAFGLFLGMAMSITAFPVLARIVQERGIHKTRLGTLVITCAAVDDISAWCMLAAIIAIFDLLLIGIGQSIFEGSLLGRIFGYTTRIVNADRLIKKVSGKEKLFGNSPFDDRTQTILSNSNVPVGIYIDKKAKGLDQVFVPFYNKKDEFLIEYIQRLIKNSEVQITVTDPAGVIKGQTKIKEDIRAIEQEAPNHITLNNDSVIDKQFIKQFQLMVISVDGWKKLVDSRSSWLNDTPSILILRA